MIGIIIISRYTVKSGHEKRRRNHELTFYYIILIGVGVTPVDKVIGNYDLRYKYCIYNTNVHSIYFTTNKTYNDRQSWFFFSGGPLPPERSRHCIFQCINSFE